MAESHAGYRIPPSQMDNVGLGNLQDKKISKSRLHYVEAPEKSDSRCLRVMNHLDFFIRYKITVFTAIISIAALILFSASIIYMALQSADNIPALIIEENPVTEYKILNEEDNQEIGRLERTMSGQLYEIVPESLGNIKNHETHKIEKRQAFKTSRLSNDENFSVGNRRLRRVETGSKREIETIRNDDKLFPNMYKIDEEKRNNEKREIERQQKMSKCRRNVNYCKSVVQMMQSFVKTTSDNLESLNKIVNQMRHEKKSSEMSQPFEDFLQCVECDQTFNDSIKFIDGSKKDEATALDDHDLDHNNENSHMKSMSSIVDLLDTLRPSVSETKSSTLPDINETSTPSPNKKKSDANTEKTVQISKTQKITDGVEVTQIIRNTTIFKQQPDGGSPKNDLKVHVPSVNVVKDESSTWPNVDFNSVTDLDNRSKIEVTDRLEVSTVTPAISMSSELPRNSLQDSSGWAETTGAEATEDKGPGTITPGDESSQSWIKKNEAIPPDEDNSSQDLSQENGTITPVRESSQDWSLKDTTDTPMTEKSSKNWDQEERTIGVPFEPRIMGGSQYQQAKGDNDGSSILLPTAETMKTSQQVQYTPPVPGMPYPVCFFGSPASGGVPTGSLKLSMPGMMPFPFTSPGAVNYPFPGNQFPQGPYGFPGQSPGQGLGYGPYQQPAAQFGTGQQFQQGIAATGFQQGSPVGPTGPGIQNFMPNFINPPTATGQASRLPYYCTYMSAPTFQFPAIPGVSEFQRSADVTADNMIEGSGKYFPEPTWNAQGSNYPGYGKQCGRDFHPCDDRSRCVSKTSWCDGKVDCPDASDEMKCSCRARITKDRICDGYFDCPRGEDELGCFGCPEDSFSCQDWTRNERRGNCVPLSQRCDGTRQCPNGKDEIDCSILTQSYIENQDVFTVGYTTGYLHKNWQGRWYPVCTPTQMWAMDACLAETGSATRGSPHIQIESTPPGQYQVPYLAQSDNGDIKIVETCYDKAIYVKCPKIPCGTRVLSNPESNSLYGQYDDSLVASTRNSKRSEKETSSDVEKVRDEFEAEFDSSKDFPAMNDTDTEIVNSDSRVVGGRASQPKAWPFLVAIYKDGFFHCGGAIINEEWILTAAHCVDRFPFHYYEIQAGLLRRYSFSPMAQTRHASYIKMHPNYEKDIMKNDVALVRLNEPLLFNRWIRPTCLPKSSTTETYWRNGPLPDTTCVTIGWGSTVEHGPDPDHLREVEVPILSECKDPEDRNDAEICAGMPQGGRDACQGDSGGPLMCNYPESVDQWYVAGIVSHGEGCGRPGEPGAYTRVSRFVNWIDEIIRTREIIMIGSKPLTICPGFSCAGGLGKCIPSNRRCDRTVNCLDAEDEINCAPYKDFSSIEEISPLQDNKKFIFIESRTKSTEALMKNKITNSSEVEVSNDTMPARTVKHSVFTMDDENSMATTEVESTTTSYTPLTSTEEISMNITSSQESMTTTNTPELSTRPNKSELLHFTCTRLIQSLPISKRCNRVIDCEDGTDEDNCTCKDYLANLYPTAICDGHVDCNDGTDEENCGFCNENEFVCSRSGTCVPLSEKCDRKNDCPGTEDELDCFALTNGNYVIMDLDKRPHLNLEGVATEWKNGTWRPVCKKFDAKKQTSFSNHFCVYFGFESAESFEQITIRDSPMEIKESTKDNLIPYEYPPSYESPGKSDHTCHGLYVRCKPVLSATTEHLIITNPKTQNLAYLWPWQAFIFVNGLYHCPAILLEHSWLLATSRCVQNLNLAENYTMALLGTTPPYRYVNSPYQQTVTIDSIKISKKLDAALLHLEYPVNMTRYVQPIFVKKRIFPPKGRDVCVATGVDEKYNTVTKFLQPITENCSHCHRCYKDSIFDDCKNKSTTNWSGTIVCRGSRGWYPAAIFHEKDILCGFLSVQTVTSIDYGNAHFMEIMDENLESIAGPHCDGFRCPLGKCIAWDKVCDGIDDCRDGSDENADYCVERKQICEITDGIGCKCSKSELRCANGQCVPKEAFCDDKIDCDDRSDETPKCTCADYLRLTAPENLCNNVRDCFDKSDESSENCPCKDASFKCLGNVTEPCVSEDFVCDGTWDCTNGEDEKTCRIVKGALKDPPGTGQVVRRSFGVWHTECFPSPVTSVKEISDLCRSMGYNFGSALEVNEEENIYGPALIPERDDFYMIRINNKTWITMRKNRPLVTLVEPRETCHRAFVNCSL